MQAATLADVEWADLPALFPELAEPRRWLPVLARHAALVESAPVRVSAVPIAEAVRRQYAECLETWRILLAAGGDQGPPATLVDVGSGGGFPGLVIAAVAPLVQVSLVEPLGKRAALLREWSAALGLTNVEVVPLRAEEAGRGPLRDSADAATARAVAPLRELAEYVAPFLRVGGLAALPKGSRLQEELAEARHALAELGCEVAAVVPMRPEINKAASVVVLRKTGPTPAKYPRRPGMPGKRPL